MRILLIGEYSGFFHYLKKGLVSLGNEVILLADGDGYKKIPGRDGCLNGKPTKNRLFRNIKKLFCPFFNDLLFRQYDAVLLINADAFSPFIIKKVFFRF